MNDNLSQLKICVEKFLPSHYNYLRNMYSMKFNNNQNFEKAKAIFFKNKLWNPKTNINIAFMSEPPYNINITNFSLNSVDRNGNKLVYDPLQLEIINNYSTFTYKNIINMIKRIVLERIQPITNLNFKFVSNPSNANIRISFDTNGGAWSYLGTDSLYIRNSMPTMNLGWFDVSTVLHEFGHVLGLCHEHQSPFDNPINWDKQAVYLWAKETQGWTPSMADQQILLDYTASEVSGSVFDPESIMLYFFPASLTLDRKGTKINSILSPNDVININSKYPGSTQTPEEFYLDVYKRNISYIFTPTPTINTTTTRTITTTPSRTITTTPSRTITTTPSRTITTTPSITITTTPSRTITTTPSITITTTPSITTPSITTQILRNRYTTTPNLTTPNLRNIYTTTPNIITINTTTPSITTPNTTINEIVMTQIPDNKKITTRNISIENILILLAYFLIVSVLIIIIISIS